MRMRNCRRPDCLLWLALGLACLGGLTTWAQPVANPPSSLPVLTNAERVLNLGLEGAARQRYSVTLTGVVTCPLPGQRWLYLQDGDAGMLVLYTNAFLRPEPGQVVQVRGRAFAGQFAVHVTDADVQVMGQSPLPEPKPADPARLAAGEDFGRWVTLEGRVVDVYTLNSNAILRLASGNQRYFVMGQSREVGVFPTGRDPPLDLLDARVAVRGICWTEVDEWNRPVGFRIHAARSNFVSVLSPGGADLFARPLTPIASLQPGAPPDKPRVKVAGTVTHFVPGQWLFLQDASGTVRAQIEPVLGRSDANRVFRSRSNLVKLSPGDQVEVVGHAILSGAVTGLTDAEYRFVRRGRPVKPTDASAAALGSGFLDSRLVKTRARLVNRQTRVWGTRVEEILILQSGDLRFHATLRTDHTNSLPSLAPGAVVQVTGVCMMSAGELGASTAPHLLLRNAGDVALVRHPWPWDSLQPGRILAVSVGLGAAAVAWIGLLRRQVRQRQRAEEKVRRSEAATRTINSFATSLLEQHDEEEILWDLAKNCVARLGFVDCVVYLLDAERGELIQKAAHGPKNPEGRHILNPLSIPLGRGIVGGVAQNGRAEIVADTRTDARYVMDGERRLSEIAVPIATEGRVLGVIDSEHPQAGFFTPEHLDLLTSIASLCANKLARVRADARLRELNQELERRIARRTAELVQANAQLRAGISERERAEHVQRALFEISEAVPAAADLPSLYGRIHAIIGTLMRADNFYLALFDEATDMVSFPYFKDLADPPPSPRKAGRGMTEYVLRSGRPTLADLNEIQRLKDAGEYVQTGHRSAIWLGVPLTLEGRTFGVMAVQDQNDPQAFGEEEKRILTFVAGQTALALERKRQEEELRASTRLLRESEERFGKAFRSTPAVLSITRLADERIIEVNEAFLETSGFARTEVLGHTTTELDLWVNPEERTEFLRQVRANGVVRSFEARLRTKQRQEETALMSAEAIELNGEPCLLALILVITARKRAEEELLRTLAQERELSELKSRFVSMVSHEFRTPLGVIMSSAEILQDYMGRLSPERRTQHLQDIFQCTRHMGALMEEVLLLSQAEAGKLQCKPVALDLVGLSQRITSEVLTATEERCPIEVQIPAPLPMADGDEGLLRHILTNLLSNAIKYSPAGVAVQFRIEKQGSNAILTVTDHGIGISEADARQLFQAFHRGGNVGQTPGSGLGLVIVKRCVELHRGRIAFDSHEGTGTTFMVFLPVFGDPPASGNTTTFLRQQTGRPNLTVIP